MTFRTRDARSPKTFRGLKNKLLTPGSSIVLPLNLGRIELPGPAGKGPGVDSCVFSYSQEGSNPGRAAARRSRPAPEAIIPNFKGSTIDGPGVCFFHWSFLGSAGLPRDFPDPGRTKRENLSKTQKYAWVFNI